MKKVLLQDVKFPTSGAHIQTQDGIVWLNVSSIFLLAGILRRLEYGVYIDI